MNNVLAAVTLQALLIFVCKIKSTDTFELLLLHTNNINFNFETDENGMGGAAKAMYLLNKFREEHKRGKGPPVLYLNAGDNFSRTRSFSVDKWNVIADCLNMLRPAAMCLGNHDLDVGLQNFTRFLQHLAVPVVATNIDFGPFRKLKTYVAASHVLTINDRKIGIIGVTTSRTAIPHKSKRILIKDEIDSVRKESQRLHDMGVQIIIVLSHSGYDVDETIGRIVDHVDVIVSGHKTSSNKLRKFRSVVKRRDKRCVPIVHEGGFLKRLGALKVTFDERGDVLKFSGEPFMLHAKIPLDKEMAQLIRASKGQRANEEIVAETRTPLTAKCYASECNYANLLTDALCNQRAFHFGNKDPKWWTDYPISIINAGTVMKKISKKGQITMGELSRTIYYDNTIILVKIQGQYIRKALQQGIGWYGDRNGGFLQFSGMHVTYNFSLVGEERIDRIYVRCGSCTVPTYEKLRRKEVYSIIVNEFMYSGHDGITAFKDNQIDQKPQHDTLGNILTMYLRRYKTVTPEHDLRLTIYGGTEKFQALQQILFFCFIPLLYVY